MLLKSSSISSQVHTWPYNHCSGLLRLLICCALFLITPRAQDTFLLGIKDAHKRQREQAKKAKGLQHLPLTNLPPALCPACCRAQPGEHPGAQEIATSRLEDTGGLKGMTFLKLQDKPTGEVAGLLARDRAFWCSCSSSPTETQAPESPPREMTQKSVLRDHTI